MSTLHAPRPSVQYDRCRDCSRAFRSEDDATRCGACIATRRARRALQQLACTNDAEALDRAADWLELMLVDAPLFARSRARRILDAATERAASAVRQVRDPIIVRDEDLDGWDPNGPGADQVDRAERTAYIAASL